MYREQLLRLSLMAAGLALASGLAGCAPPDSDVPDSTPAAAAATTPAAAATTVVSPTAAAALPGDPPEVVVDASDYKYQAPNEVPAGMTRFTMQNAGKEPHQVALFQLADGKAFEDFAAATAGSDEGSPLPDWVVPAGGPNAAMPGASSSSFVDLQPGYYVMLCNIPDAKGTPHYKLGMIRPLRVGPAAEPAAQAPPADGSIKAEDFAFGVESTMAAGDHVLSFVNDGQQPHEATLFKLNEGATAKDVAAAFAPGASGPPPAVAVGGVVALAPKAEQSFPVTLTPGRYALLCFLPDAATGKPHVQLGMMAEFDVK